MDVLEKNGQGLNLTHEVRDGILKHSKGYGRILPEDPAERAFTLEGQVVRVADIMAYLNHDLDDAVRSGVVEKGQIPAICTDVLGRTHSDRATTMVRDLVFTSRPRNGTLVLEMSDEVFQAMIALRKFLFENVYRAIRVHKEFVKAKKILSELYAYFLENGAMLQQELEKMDMGACNRRHRSRERVVCDFLASTTDRYALNLYGRIFFPSPMV